jgi:hypothetical protein
MSEASELATLYTFLLGEAYDDLLPAFVVDGRDYRDPDAVRADVSAAREQLRHWHIIADCETSRVTPASPVPSLPRWPEWRERHVIRGEPLLVRPLSPDRRVPAGFGAMFEWLEGVRVWLQAEMLAAARAVVRSSEPKVSRDKGTVRRSAASVDLSEERYGVKLAVEVLITGDGTAAVRAVADALAAKGWVVGAVSVGDRTVDLSAQLDGHSVAVVMPHDEKVLTLIGSSAVVEAGDFTNGYPAASQGSEGQ